MVSIQAGCATMLALMVAQTPTPAPKGKPAPKTVRKSTGATELLGRVQKHYEKLQDYSADFIQIYTRVALSRKSESRGKLMIKKPGMMRWEYQKPEPKLWIVNGRKLVKYDQEFDEVLIDKNFGSQRLSDSISFLWGEGKLAKTFNAKVGQPEAVGAAKGTPVLELTPKKDATYTKLVLVLDPKSGHVVESIIYETSGNTNHFKFKNLKLNTGLKKSVFEFEIPPDASVTER